MNKATKAIPTPKPVQARTEVVETVEIIDQRKDAPEDPRTTIAKKYDKNRDQQSKELNAQPIGDTDSKPGNDQQLDKSKSGDTLHEVDSGFIPIKINGAEHLVPKERVEKAGGIAAYQKEVAVMQGFKDISEQNKLLRQREEDLDKREADFNKKALPTLDEPAKTKTDLPVQGDQTTKKDLIRQQREAILDGDDELADSLMDQLTPDSTSVNSEVLEAAVDKTIKELDDRAALKESQDNYQAILDARSGLYKTHPELKNDARLFQAVDDETDRVEREFPDYSPSEVMEESFKRVQEWRGIKRTDSMSTKQNEKRSMIRPTASTGRAKAPPMPERNTDSSYVQQLKTARGQG